MKSKHPFTAMILACSLAAMLTAGCGSSTSASEASQMTRLKNVTSSSDTASVLSGSGDDSVGTDEPWSTDTAKEELTKILSSDLNDHQAVLDVPEMLQNPELPTGCESVALTIALNSLGCSLNKTDIAEQYLEYGNNLAYQYAGDPHTDSGAGVFAAGIVNAAEKYIKEQNLDIAVFNTSGTSLSDLYKVVDAGYPVVIWGTMYMSDPIPTSQTYDYNGYTYTWYQNEHCMVLCGYDEDANTVVVSDPLSGIVVRDASQYESYFQETGQYSVVLMNENGVQKTTLDTSKTDTDDASKADTSSENYQKILSSRQDTSNYSYNQWQNNGDSSGSYYNNYDASAYQGQSYDAPSDSGSGNSQSGTNSASPETSQSGSGSGSQASQNTSQSGGGSAQDSNAGGSGSGTSDSGSSDTPSGGGGDDSGNNGGGSSGTATDDSSGGGSGSGADTPQTPGSTTTDGGGTTDGQTES